MPILTRKEKMELAKRAGLIKEENDEDRKQCLQDEAVMDILTYKGNGLSERKCTAGYSFLKSLS